MTRALLFLVVLVTLYTSSVQSLKCQEGFNASVMGVPFYHWSERDCMSNSDCFTQEIEIQLPVYQLGGSVRYGGCISRSYSPVLTCEKLFGPKSDLDPVTVFKMLPQLDRYFEAIDQDFVDSKLENFRLLYSNGTGPGSFIDGCYRLLSNLGLKTEKALPLRTYFVKMWESVLAETYGGISSGPLTPTGSPLENSEQFFVEFYQTFKSVINDYKVIYPKSDFPEIVWKFANYINDSNTRPPHYDCGSLYMFPEYNQTKVEECYRKQGEAHRDFYRKAYNSGISLSVDLQFAIFNEIDFTNMDIYQEIQKVFPDLQFFVRLMRTLDRGDVKELLKGFFDWYDYPRGRPYSMGFFQRLVALTNQTISKITAKLGEFNKELRREFSPRSCKFYSCKTDNCNTQQSLTNVKQVLTIRHASKEKAKKDDSDSFRAKPTSTSKKPETQSDGPATEAIKASTTTNDSPRIRSSYLLTAITLYMLQRLL